MFGGDKILEALQHASLLNLACYAIGSVVCGGSYGVCVSSLLSSCSIQDLVIDSVLRSWSCNLQPLPSSTRGVPWAASGKVDFGKFSITYSLVPHLRLEVSTKLMCSH